MDTQLYPQHRTLFIALIIIVVMIFLALFTYWLRVEQSVEPLVSSPEESLTQEPSSGFPTSEDIIPAESIVNPAEALPNDNPFATETNPFEDAYKNPFE